MKNMIMKHWHSYIPSYITCSITASLCLPSIYLYLYFIYPFLHIETYINKHEQINIHTYIHTCTYYVK
ncbi:hypothetical protein CI102_4932 [Trichoderma harzianum]|nr:hypothetical protein CI102_4932 [Trichoderma harzianum]